MQKNQQEYWLDGRHLAVSKAASQSIIFAAVPARLWVSPVFRHPKKNLPKNVGVLNLNPGHVLLTVVS